MSNLIDLDFIEIGTSNFETLIQDATNESKGLTIEPIKYYLDQLPNKPNVKKINKAITNKIVEGNDTIEIYYIPEDIIKSHNLYSWYKGCNTIGRYHPLHVKYNVTQFVKKEIVQLQQIDSLFIEHNIRKVKFLKIDTEGHDCIIMRGLYNHICNLSKDFYPDKIMFETNSNSTVADVDEILKLFLSIGYNLIERGSDDTIISL